MYSVNASFLTLIILLLMVIRTIPDAFKKQLRQGHYSSCLLFVLIIQLHYSAVTISTPRSTGCNSDHIVSVPVSAGFIYNRHVPVPVSAGCNYNNPVSVPVSMGCKYTHRVSVPVRAGCSSNRIVTVQLYGFQCVEATLTKGKQRFQ